MRFKGLWVAALAAFACFGLPAQAADGPVIIKFSHVVAPDTPKGKGAAKFKELAEAALPGRVVIELYPNSQLYKDKEEMEALQLGSVQMLAPSLAKFGPLGAKEFEVFDLPFIFKDYDALRRVTDGPLGREMLGKLKSKGITGLAFWDNGFKIMSANRPLRLPEDMLGLKMRIQSSKMLEAEMTALGASPQVLAFGETYQALGSGVVDGTENPPSNMYTQRMHEVQKYAVITNHGYLGYAVIVNTKFWEGLPADMREALTKAMATASAYVNELAAKDNTDAMTAMKATGKTQFLELTPEDRKAWVDALQPVQDQMAGRVGPRLLAAIRAASSGQAASASDKPAAPEAGGSKAAAGEVWSDSTILSAIGVLVAGLILLAAFAPKIPALDRIEEFAVASLIAMATVLIFTAVVQRYSITASANAARFAADHNQPWLRSVALGVFKSFRLFNLTWAQEACIYMFVWMAKLGAALGVRQGIHVGVDVLTNMLGSKSRRPVIAFALLCGAIFTGVIGSLGTVFVTHLSHTDQTSPDLELPIWIVYLAIPIGSFLMCFRFLQVFFTYIRGGELPGHGHMPVEVPGTQTEEVTA